jgi:two-component system, cell cycle sensor histidine kinase and response regulator CckA
LAEPLHVPTILVVDDEPSVRQMTRRILEDAGYRVGEAENGARALGILMQGGIDAVVTDIRMPGLDGWELAGRLSLMTPRPAILFMSGYDVHLGLPGFAGPLLAKPFRPEQLISAVQRMLPSQQQPQSV